MCRRYAFRTWIRTPPPQTGKPTHTRSRSHGSVTLRVVRAHTAAQPAALALCHRAQTKRARRALARHSTHRLPTARPRSRTEQRHGTRVVSQTGSETAQHKPVCLSSHVHAQRNTQRTPGGCAGRPCCVPPTASSAAASGARRTSGTAAPTAGGSRRRSTPRLLPVCYEWATRSLARAMFRRPRPGLPVPKTLKRRWTRRRLILRCSRTWADAERTALRGLLVPWLEIMVPLADSLFRRESKLASESCVSGPDGRARCGCDGL